MPRQQVITPQKKAPLRRSSNVLFYDDPGGALGQMALGASFVLPSRCVPAHYSEGSSIKDDSTRLSNDWALSQFDRFAAQSYWMTA